MVDEKTFYHVQSLDLLYWKNQWDTYKIVLDKLKDQIEQSGDFSARAVLQDMVSSLAIFAKKHFDFFLDGLTHKQDHRLEEDPGLHGQYILQKALWDIIHDTKLLHEVIAQRNYHGGTEIGDTLKLADKLAWSAMQPAIDANLMYPDEENKRDFTVITYFQKSPRARIVPYANVGLIGIPYSTVHSPVDHLAIPHEVGHFVFRKMTNAKFRFLILELLENTLSAFKKKSDIDWVKAWFEEIFCDVYGCMVAGLPIGLSFQNLSMGYKDLFENDYEHPIPYLRPFVYGHTFEQWSLTSQLARNPSRLNTNWDSLKLLAHNGVSNFDDRVIGSHGSNDITVKDAKEALTAVVDMLVSSKFLGDIKQPYWGMGIDETTEVNKYYNKFSTFVESIDIENDVAPFNTVPTDGAYEVPWHIWAGLTDSPIMQIDFDQWKVGTFPIPLTNEISKKTWGRILDAGVWSTEGPGSRPDVDGG